ncbi:hypothetical protein Dimus_008484, partial [Dionaea muscipula]
SLFLWFVWGVARRAPYLTVLLDGASPVEAWRRRPRHGGDRRLWVAHPRLMWSSDSTRHRNSRVRSVVERTLREGMGSEEQDLRPDVPDFAVVVAPQEDLASIEVIRPDLNSSSSGSVLTMAEPLHDQPLGLPDERGCEVALGQSLVDFVHSVADNSEIVVADVPANHLADPVICGAPAMRIGDGEEIHMSAEGPDAAMSSPYLMVSVSSSPRLSGLLVTDAEVRGSEDGKRLLPVVSVHPDSGDGCLCGWQAYRWVG